MNRQNSIVVKSEAEIEESQQESVHSAPNKVIKEAIVHLGHALIIDELQQ